MDRRDMSVLILCGGLGTRAYPYTSQMPKALMEVDEVPIVEQVMRIYGSFGYRNFVLSVGYLKEQIIDYFERQNGANGWKVTCVDTGVETDTGGRIFGCRDHLTPVFHATYCDGLGDLDLDALVDIHQAHGGLATMTTVPLRSQYGLVHFTPEGEVTHFEEKPILLDRWINAGFFVFDVRAFNCWQGENLEKHVLPHLSERGELYVYSHHGFWRSMDTYKDQQELSRLWRDYAASCTPAAVDELSSAWAGAASGGE
jgi:glucose-1-phosphate cytidylyltransferase